MALASFINEGKIEAVPPFITNVNMIGWNSGTLYFEEIKFSYHAIHFDRFGELDLSVKFQR